VVDTRNYLTHYPEELEETAATDWQNQYGLIQKMKLLMQLCFFIELGLPAEVVDKITANNHKFRNLPR